ncbi:MAG: hypothetical protein SGILL_001258 [Bacillariaceae sp.]
MVDKQKLLAMSDAERRSFKHEERIKGGSEKAVVRVRLSDEASLGIPLDRKSKKSKQQALSNLEAKWVIRKRVPTKIVRKVASNRAAAKKTSKGSTDDAHEPNDASNGHVNGASEDDVEKEPPKKKKKITTFNKDFSVPRYLGDGKDPPSQQEANWRWQAGKYSPFSFLTDRPLSRAMIQKLSYNFVGEVIGMEPDLSPGASTLAYVTLRRLVLPEHTLTGRMANHGPYDVFEDGDINVASLVVDNAEMNSCFLRVPIEELVIVGRKLRRSSTETEPSPLEMTIQRCYSFHTDTYIVLEGDNRVEMALLDELSSQVVQSFSTLGSTVKDLAEYSTSEDSGFMTTRFIVKGMESIDFAYNAQSLASPLNTSSTKPITKVRAKTQKLKKPAILDFGSMTAGETKNREGMKSPIRAMSPTDVPVKEVFKPTAARSLPYDAENRRFAVSATEIYQWRLSQPTPISSLHPEKPRNLRRFALRYADPETAEQAADSKKLVGRAARANQRRLARGIASMGVTVDTLAGREQYIRFDRSGIHDWGVYVDIDVREEEMIVEYRGEIIGNAVAEKREKKYEEEKIGSDYMFRIDELVKNDLGLMGL